MKNFTFKALIVLFLLSFSAYAQQQSKSVTINTDDIIRCGSDEYNAKLLQQNPNMMGSENFERILANKIAEQDAFRASNANQMVVVTIPVVIHILHNGEAIGTGPNISDAQAISQITVLNEDYRRIMGTRGFNSNPIGADVEVEFCLAQTDPNGAPTSGINRVNIGQNGIVEASFADAQNQMDALKPSSIWPAADYMNMWSIAFNGGSGLLGYAQFPGGPANTDGVVSDYRFFGSNDAAGVTLAGPFNLGRTMTHEVGHFLGLFHTFRGGCGATGSGAGDFCADTPTVASDDSNGSVCNTGNDSCPGDPGLDMVENYMDYSTDACFDTFTQDQKARIVAVLASQPNRASLTSSNVCVAPTTPFINFSPGSNPPGQTAEGNGCNFQDFNIDLTLTLAASADATANLVNSGTATEGEDFMLMNNSVTFTQGSTTPSNTITLRILNDRFVESDETITLSLNVNTTGDALATSNTYDAIIANDDSAITSSGNATLFSDGFENYTDFEIAPVGSWTMLDNDGDNTYGTNTTTWTNSGYIGTFMVFNPSQTSPSLAGTVWDANTGDKGYYCFNATGNNSGLPIENDDYIFTPQISLNDTNSSLSFFAKSLTNEFGLERFQVGVSTTDTNPASFTYLTPTPYEQAPVTWTQFTYDLSAYDGQNIYITFHVVSADAFVFMLDDVLVTADFVTLIQTDDNSATPDQFNLNTTGIVYSRDTTSGNAMVDIDNTGGFDFGCVGVAVSRDLATAGADAVSYNGGTDVAGFVTAKTFDITTANPNTADASTVNFYFTEAEIVAWETATGNNRSALYVKKESTDEVVPVTVSAFGAELKLSASLTTGLSGTYVFGAQLAFLSTNDFELAKGLSIYPNPTSEILIINVTDGNDMPDSYKVYNMLGQLVIENKINTAEDLSINTTSYSNGVYFIKIAKDNKAVTLPFIKK